MRRKSFKSRVVKATVTDDFILVPNNQGIMVEIPRTGSYVKAKTELIKKACQRQK
jgi:hypothetical protein